MSSTNRWEELIGEGAKISIRGDIAWVDAEPEQGSAARFFTESPRRAFLDKLSRNADHQANWELGSYLPLLERFVSPEIRNEGDQAVLVDLGCGDGRFTLWALRNFDCRVIAVDIVAEALESLAEVARAEGFEQRLLIVRAGLDELPLESEIARCVIAINSLYYLQDKVKKGVSEMARILEPHGTAVSTRHVPEAVLLRTLFFNGVGPFLDSVESREVAESPDEHAPRFRFFSKDEEVALFEGTELVERECGGIPLFEQIVSLVGRTNAAEMEVIEDSRDRLARALEQLRRESDWYRTMVVKRTKTIRSV